MNRWATIIRPLTRTGLEYFSGKACLTKRAATSRSSFSFLGGDITFCRELIEHEKRRQVAALQSYLVLVGAKPLPVLTGSDERFHHIGVNKVAVERIQLV